MWNETFTFDIQVPELAMLRFVAEDYDSTSQNDLIGQYCLPLTSVQNGKRAQLKQREALNWRKQKERSPDVREILNGEGDLGVYRLNSKLTPKLQRLTKQELLTALCDMTYVFHI